MRGSKGGAISGVIVPGDGRRLAASSTTTATVRNENDEPSRLSRRARD
jgi:hypothetical protein